MKVDVLNINGGVSKSVDLPEDIFGIEPNQHAMYLAVKSYQAAQRQGTHKSKERNEIAGSTRKIKKQKGTGGARAGSIKNPLFKGGGRVFGPRPRTYVVSLNKKVARLARKSALSQRYAGGNLRVVEDFTFSQPRTKEYLTVLENMKLSNSKSLLVIGDYDSNVYLSSRNVPNARVVSVSELNTFELIAAREILICESAVEKLKASFA
jgi:large subunit ribosomal protein L4